MIRTAHCRERSNRQPGQRPHAIVIGRSDQAPARLKATRPPGERNPLIGLVQANGLEPPAATHWPRAEVLFVRSGPVPIVSLGLTFRHSMPHVFFSLREFRVTPEWCDSDQLTSSRLLVRGGFHPLFRSPIPLRGLRSRVGFLFVLIVETQLHSFVVIIIVR